jgi:hypothetical protein
MLRLVLLSLGAALYVTGAQAHQVHANCQFGNTHSGEMMHYHPGAYGNAVPCSGGPGYGPRGGGGYGRGYGGGYYQEPPPPPPTDYYGGGGGYYGGDGGYEGEGGYYRRRGYGGGGRPGDYGPQTNRGQDCYNIGGNRVCCPKGWTVQGGSCKPYRGY